MPETTPIDLQADLVERLLSDEYFSDLGVMDERKGDIAAELEKSLSMLTEKTAKIGAAVVLLSPIGSDENPDATFGPMGLAITALVLENVLLNSGANGTQKRALTIARRVHRVLKHYRAGGIANALVPEKNCIVPVENPIADVAYEVRFRTTEADRTVYTKVLAPIITPNTGAHPQTVTLACGTVGASIYYTLDGTYPRAGNTAATLYTAPFSITAAATLRVGAYKTGSIPSDTIDAIFT